MGRRIVLVVIAAILIAGGAVFAFKYDEWLRYPSLRVHVNNQMKDPGSTQYRNEHLSRD